MPICIACRLPIYRGQPAMNIECGVAEESPKSQMVVFRPHGSDMIHRDCYGKYNQRIDTETYDVMMDYLKPAIRKQVIDELKEELRAQIYDEVVDSLGRECASCHAEIEAMGAPDDSPQLPYHPPLPPMPGVPMPFPGEG